MRLDQSRIRPYSHPTQFGQLGAQRRAARDRATGDAQPVHHRPMATSPTRTIDRDRLASLSRGRERAVPRRPPALGGAVRARPPLPPRRRPDELDGRVGVALPALRRRGVGRPFPMRRRPRIRRLLPRRHGRDGRSRPRPDDRRRRAPDAPRHHPHAPDRGRDRRGRGARPAVRAAVLAVHDDRHRRQSVLDPARPPGDRPIEDRRPRPLLPRLGRRDVRDARPGWPGRRERRAASGRRSIPP